MVNETDDPSWSVGGGAFFAVRETAHTANNAVVRGAMTRHTKRAPILTRAILSPRSRKIKKKTTAGWLVHCHNRVTLEGDSGELVYAI